MSKDKRWAYFDASGELLLSILEQVSDLPEDVKLMKVEIAPSDGFAGKYSSFNKIRFYVESEKFKPLLEASPIPDILPKCDHDKWLKVKKK